MLTKNGKYFITHPDPSRIGKHLGKLLEFVDVLPCGEYVSETNMKKYFSGGDSRMAEIRCKPICFDRYVFKCASGYFVVPNDGSFGFIPIRRRVGIGGVE